MYRCRLERCLCTTLMADLPEFMLAEYILGFFLSLYALDVEYHSRTTSFPGDKKKKTQKIKTNFDALLSHAQ